MTTCRRVLVLLPVVLTLALAIAASGASRQVTIAPAPAAELQTAVFEPEFLDGNPGPLFSRTRAAGARVVRLVVDWAAIAPEGDTRPASFDPSDPSDPRYRWDSLDRSIRSAVAHHLQPILSLYGAPLWAQANRSGSAFRSWYGPYRPDPKQYRIFAKAVATRYDGKHKGLPRVRYWQAWNEPNIDVFLAPLYDRGKPFAPGRYRQLVNDFADAVHGVHADNLVIAGGLAPFTVKKGVSGSTIGPMAFMRSMLCMSGGAHPKPTCKSAAEFDVWAIHPYTSGNAFHKASNKNDVSLGDLGKVRSLLTAAGAHGHVVARKPVRLWVTEVAWDTDPPDENAVPITLQARWTSEALYQCWLNGVDLVTWFKLRDDPVQLGSPFQSGLYFSGKTLAGDRKKPTFTAFRFPFVAFPNSGKIYVWGRTPDSKAHTVVIQHKLGFLGWEKIATLKADKFGIFQGVLDRGWKTGYLRARIGKDLTLGFGLREPKDRIVRPFG